MYLVRSIFGVGSWDIPLQPSVPHGFPFWVGSFSSSLQGDRTLAQILGFPAFSFFSSISFLSFLFSCCRWSMTLWRWLWEGEGREDGRQPAHLLGSLLERTQKVSQRRRKEDLPFQNWVRSYICPVSHRSSLELAVRKTRAEDRSASSRPPVYTLGWGQLSLFRKDSV